MKRLREWWRHRNFLISCVVASTDQPGWEGAEVHVHGKRHVRMYLVTPHKVAYCVPPEQWPEIFKCDGWVEAVDMLRSEPKTQIDAVGNAAINEGESW